MCSERNAERQRGQEPCVNRPSAVCLFVCLGSGEPFAPTDRFPNIRWFFCDRAAFNLTYSYLQPETLSWINGLQPDNRKHTHTTQSIPTQIVIVNLLGKPCRLRCRLTQYFYFGLSKNFLFLTRFEVQLWTQFGVKRVCVSDCV